MKSYLKRPLVNVPSIALAALIATAAIAQEDNPGLEAGAETYRLQHYADWAWQGGNLDLIEAAAARVIASGKPRSNPEWSDTVTAFGPGNWIWEFEQLGDTAAAEAAKLDGRARADKLLEASTYYTVASYPHTNDPDAARALGKAYDAYETQANERDDMEFETLTLRIDGATVQAYLYLPEGGDEPYPLVIQSYGSDFVQTQSFKFFDNELRSRNIALVSIDLPGIGLSRDLAMTPGTIDSIHRAVIAELADHSDIDTARIGIHGTSFGGNPAARLALDPPAGVRAVVVHCAALSHAFGLPEPVYEHFAQLAKDGIVDSMKAESWDAALPAFRGFDMENFGLGDKPVVPAVLAVLSNEDVASPIEDSAELVAQSADGQMVLFDDEGHCLDRTVETPISAAWLAEKLGAEY